MLNQIPLPPIGDVAHCTPQGVRTWRPAFNALDVCRVKSGAMVLTLSTPSLCDPVLFELDPDACAHLVRLLIGTEGAPATSGSSRE